MKKVICTIFAIAAYFLLINASCDDNNNPVNPNGKEIESNTQTITTTGGEIALTDGTKLIVPAGATSQSTSIKMSRIEANDFFPGQKDDFVILRFESDVTEFNQDLEIRIPVPKKFTNPSNVLGAGGEFDFTNQIMDITSTTIENVNGKYELVIKTKHFSGYAGHFWEMPPNSAGPLDVPYFNQGSSNYCWATCLQMMCEGIDPSISNEIYSWIAATGIDEGGVGQDFVLSNSKLHSEIKYQTGSYPEAKRWQYLSAKAMDTYLRDRIALGYPVLVMDPFSEHAILVVGYSGNTFYIHNPNNTNNSNIGYSEKQWSDFKVDQLGIRDLYVTLCIPKSLSSTRMQTVNITNGTIKIIKPKIGSENSMIYGFKWSPTSNGYGFFENAGTGKLVDTLPDGIETIQIKGIDIANASRTQSKTFNIWVDIWGLDNKKIHKSFEPKDPVNVGPNSIGTYSIDIPVAEFKDSTMGATTSYRMQISAIEQGSGLVDDESILFTIGPSDPLNGAWEFTTTRLSTTSPKGSYNIDNETIDFIFTVISSEIIRLSTEYDDDGIECQLERTPGSNSFRIFYEENGEVQIDIECEFLPNNYNQYEGTLTTVDWEYLTDEDRENDIRTPYTCTATVVGIRKK